MNTLTSTAEQLIDLIQGRAPEFLDLLTASSESEFDEALEFVVAKAINLLEENSANFSTLGEVELTAVLAGALSIPGITVTQESHSNGHVDITISQNYSSPPRKRLGEAKLYGGYAYHVKGLEQLVARYSTGRHGRGLILAYFRNKNIKGAITTLRAEMDKDLPQGQIGKTNDGSIPWSFFSKHEHSSGSDIDVAHYGCNMYNPVAATAKASIKDRANKDTSNGK